MIKLPSYFLGFSSKSDGSAGLRFATNEISPEEFANMKRCLNAFGWLLFSENDISTEDIPKEAVEDANLTPSKRLRSVLFVYWKQLGEKGDFEQFYREKVEGFIKVVKSKLDV